MLRPGEAERDDSSNDLKHKQTHTCTSTSLVSPRLVFRGTEEWYRQGQGRQCERRCEGEKGAANE